MTRPSPGGGLVPPRDREITLPDNLTSTKEKYVYLGGYRCGWTDSAERYKDLIAVQMRDVEEVIRDLLRQCGKTEQEIKDWFEENRWKWGG